LRKKEIMYKILILTWENRKLVAINWNVNNCEQSDFEEEDKNKNFGHIRFEMPME
jgi:hypothetical protein